MTLQYGGILKQLKMQLERYLAGRRSVAHVTPPQVSDDFLSLTLLSARRFLVSTVTDARRSLLSRRRTPVSASAARSLCRSQPYTSPSGLSRLCSQPLSPHSGLDALLSTRSAPSAAPWPLLPVLSRPLLSAAHTCLRKHLARAHKKNPHLQQCANHAAPLQSKTGVSN